MKRVEHIGYDVEVNGQVVGHASEYPDGWEANGVMTGINVWVHGHDSLESACMAVGRALMGGPQITQLENNRAHYQNAERELSDAYLRLRKILDAFRTPHAPTKEQVWEHTESKATELVNEHEQLIGMHLAFQHAIGAVGAEAGITVEAVGDVYYLQILAETELRLRSLSKGYERLRAAATNVACDYAQAVQMLDYKDEAQESRALLNRLNEVLADDLSMDS